MERSRRVRSKNIYFCYAATNMKKVMRTQNHAKSRIFKIFFVKKILNVYSIWASPLKGETIPVPRWDFFSGKKIPETSCHNFAQNYRKVKSLGIFNMYSSRNVHLCGLFDEHFYFHDFLGWMTLTTKPKNPNFGRNWENSPNIMQISLFGASIVLVFWSQTDQCCFCRFENLDFACFESIWTHPLSFGTVIRLVSTLQTPRDGNGLAL